MNIDIVNTQVSKNLNINIKDVELINNFYWRQIKEHMYSLNPQPINIHSICVFYPNKYNVKFKIIKFIRMLRHVRSGKVNYKPELAKSYTDRAIYYIQNLLKIRKYYKYTN